MLRERYCSTAAANLRHWLSLIESSAAWYASAMSLASGLFPTQFPQAARASSMCVDASGRVVLAAMSQAASALGSGSATGPGTQAYSPSASAWSLGPGATTPLDSVAGVQPGWILDSLLGLAPWNGSPAGASPPYVALVSGASGVYAVGPGGIWNQAGGLVAGTAVLSGCVAAAASGTSIYALASGALYAATLATSASATVTSTALPSGIVGSAVGVVTGGVVAVGGWLPSTFSPGAVAMAMGPSMTALLTLPGASSAYAWTLAGNPPQFSLLASGAGLPAYSSNVGLAFTKAGTQVLLNDATSGYWASFSYIGGTLGLLSSGSLSGQVAGIVGDDSSSYAVIGLGGASGYYALYLSGPSWVASGVVATGLPSACAPHLLSGQTWAVGWGSGGSGSLGLLAYSTVFNSWSLTPIVTGLPWIPQYIVSDQGTSSMWVIASGAPDVLFLSNSPGGETETAGVWTSAMPTGRVVLPLVNRLQLVVAASGPNSLSTCGPVSTTSLAPKFTESIAFSPTSVAGPFLDGTIAVASSGSIYLYRFDAPWMLDAQRSGYWTTWQGGVFSAVTGLGQSQIPSLFAIDGSGTVLLGTLAGGLGAASGAPASLTPTVASGGVAAAAVASGSLWLASTVGGALYQSSE